MSVVLPSLLQEKSSDGRHPRSSTGKRRCSRIADHGVEIFGQGIARSENVQLLLHEPTDLISHLGHTRYTRLCPERLLLRRPRQVFVSLRWPRSQPPDHGRRSVQPAARAALRSPRFRACAADSSFPGDRRSPCALGPLGCNAKTVLLVNRSHAVFPEGRGWFGDPFPARDFLSLLGLAHAARRREKPGPFSQGASLWPRFLGAAGSVNARERE